MHTIAMGTKDQKGRPPAETHDSVTELHKLSTVIERSLAGPLFFDPANPGPTERMEQSNAGYLQLGLVALVFGGLQVWWIGSTLRKRNLARPLSEGEFRKTLERIWAKPAQKG